MGMCKGCNEVYNTSIMREGYCESCKPEFFTKEYEEKKLHEPIIKKESKDLSGKQVNIIISIAVAVVLVVVGIFAYNKMTKPSNSILKSLVLDFDFPNIRSSDIEVVNSYKKYGKTVYILNIKNMTCEMPVIKSASSWKAIKINCN